MARIEQLVERYANHIGLPWPKHLARAERAIFVVYDKSDERRLRARRDLFALATQEAGHQWFDCDITTAFADWMASFDPDDRESYFESPDDLALRLDGEFLDIIADKVRQTLTAREADDQSVVGVFGIASMYGFARVSKLMKVIEPHIRGRIVVFFPGEHENNNYRLLDARDGWNYHAVSITLHNGMFD